MQDVEISDVATFFVDHAISDNLGVIANSHLAWADISELVRACSKLKWPQIKFKINFKFKLAYSNSTRSRFQGLISNHPVQHFACRHLKWPFQFMHFVRVSMYHLKRVCNKTVKIRSCLQMSLPAPCKRHSKLTYFSELGTPCTSV